MIRRSACEGSKVKLLKSFSSNSFLKLIVTCLLSGLFHLVTLETIFSVLDHNKEWGKNKFMQTKYKTSTKLMQLFWYFFLSIVFIFICKILIHTWIANDNSARFINHWKVQSLEKYSLFAGLILFNDGDGVHVHAHVHLYVHDCSHLSVCVMSHGHGLCVPHAI